MSQESPAVPIDKRRPITLIDSIIIAGALLGAAGYAVSDQLQMAVVFLVMGIGYVAYSFAIHFLLRRTQRESSVANETSQGGNGDL